MSCSIRKFDRMSLKTSRNWGLEVKETFSTSVTSSTPFKSGCRLTFLALFLVRSRAFSVLICKGRELAEVLSGGDDASVTSYFVDRTTDKDLLLRSAASFWLLMLITCSGIEDERRRSNAAVIFFLSVPVASSCLGF